MVTLLDILIDKYGCECSRRDIQRMELIIMQKLEFHLSRPTIEDFIRSFHSLALSSNLFHLPINLSVDRHLNHLFKCAQHVICSHHLMKHKPSMLALAVLGCDLKLLECDWLSTILSLQTLSQVRGGELSVCYEAVAAKYPEIVAQYPLPLSPIPLKPPRQKWRKVVMTVPSQSVDEKTGSTEKNCDDTRHTELTSSLCRTINIAIV